MKQEKYINYLHVLRSNKVAIFVIMGVVITAAIVYSVLQTPMYKAESELLIVQKQDDQMDAYTASRAAEKLGNSLTRVIYTTSFFDKILVSEYIDATDFPTNEIEKRKVWKEMVSAAVIPETGIITIITYGASPEKAVNLAMAVNDVLMYENWEYHGGGDNVFVSNINTPIASGYPAKPNIVLNSVAGLIIGLLISFSYVVIKEEFRGKGTVKDVKDKKYKKTDIFNLAKLEQAFEQPLYKVLDHQNSLDFEYAFAENSEPVTMHDHI